MTWAHRSRSEQQAPVLSQPPQPPLAELHQCPSLLLWVLDSWSMAPVPASPPRPWASASPSAERVQRLESKAASVLSGSLQWLPHCLTPRGPGGLSLPRPPLLVSLRLCTGFLRLLEQMTARLAASNTSAVLACSPGAQKSKTGLGGPKIKASAAHFPSGGLRGKCVLSSSPSGGCWNSLARGPTSI